MYALPGRVHWLVSRHGDDGLTFEEAGTLSVESAVFPPPPESLSELLKRSRIAWSLQVPLAIRTALVPLPALAARELEQGVMVRSDGRTAVHVEL